MKAFADFGIETEGHAAPEFKTLCPRCSHKRVHSNERCLSVNAEKGLWFCHNCGWKGSLMKGETSWSKPEYEENKNNFSRILSFFAQRGISEPTVRRYKLSAGIITPEGGKPKHAVRFPYFRKGECINIKTRGIDEKCFKQEPNAEKIFYGLDDIEGQERIIIVEGECDKLALAEVGIFNVVSVPDGALPPDSNASDKKFEYVTNCWSELEGCREIILATDCDEPGMALQRELAKRLGIERCYIPEWPEGCKDANEVLTKLGARALMALVDPDNVNAVPLQRQVTPKQLLEMHRKLRAGGIDRGRSTGFTNLDRFFRLASGTFVVVTGVPGHGKTEFLDDLIVNSAKEHGWVWSALSLENSNVALHWDRLMTKWIGRDPGTLSPAGIEEVHYNMSQHIIMNEYDGGVTLDEALDLFRMQAFRSRLDAVVLDPWNMVDSMAGEDRHGITGYVGHACNQMRWFCQQHDIAFFLVVHPSKLKRGPNGKYTPPTPYDMSGSAHWFNRPDFILCVYRNIMNDGNEREMALIENSTTVYVQKCKYDHLGGLGEAVLYRDPLSRRFSERPFYPVGDSGAGEPKPTGSKVVYEDEPKFPGFG